MSDIACAISSYLWSSTSTSISSVILTVLLWNEQTNPWVIADPYFPPPPYHWILRPHLIPPHTPRPPQTLFYLYSGNGATYALSATSPYGSIHSSNGLCLHPHGMGMTLRTNNCNCSPYGNDVFSISDVGINMYLVAFSAVVAPAVAVSLLVTRLIVLYGSYICVPSNGNDCAILVSYALDTIRDWSSFCLDIQLRSRQ